MMIIVISFCIKRSEYAQYFHYKGYFLGQKINKIEVNVLQGQFEIQQEYLLKLKVLRIEKSVLICDVLQSKKLEGLSLI